MRPLLLLAPIGLLMGAIAAGVLSFGGDARAKEEEIEVDNYYFCDASFENGVCEKTINVGDTVTWSVEEGPHTVTQCDDSFATCPPSGGFNSGALQTAGQFSHTFAAAGTFSYHCQIHPDQMHGRIVVVAPTATPTPTPSAAPAAATPTPAASPARVPATGGPPGGNGSFPWQTLLAGLGVLLLGASAVITARNLRLSRSERS